MMDIIWKREYGKVRLMNVHSVLRQPRWVTRTRSTSTVYGGTVSSHLLISFRFPSRMERERMSSTHRVGARSDHNRTISYLFFLKKYFQQKNNHKSRFALCLTFNTSNLRMQGIWSSSLFELKKYNNLFPVRRLCDQGDSRVDG